LFSAVISEHFSKNRVIISVVAAKIWYLKNVRFLLGHPVDMLTVCRSCKQELTHIDKVLDMFTGAAAAAAGTSDSKHRLISVQSQQRNAVSL